MVAIPIAAELSLEALTELLGAEAAAYVTASVEGAVAEVLTEGMGLATSPTLKAWVSAAVVSTLEHLYGEDDHKLRHMATDTFAAAAVAIITSEPGAVKRAMRRALSSPQILSLVAAFKGKIIEEATPRSARLLADVAYADIPDDTSVMAWAAALAKKYGMTVDDIITMRAAARRK